QSLSPERWNSPPTYTSPVVVVVVIVVLVVDIVVVVVLVVRRCLCIVSGLGIAWMGNAPCCEPFDTREPEAVSSELEAMIAELFRLHDLNADGVLDERELIKLNEKVAKLHYGLDIDKAAVKTKYESVFRGQLDAAGRPVPYRVFRRYMLRLLPEFDSDRLAQEMIVEQFVAEARAARAAFHEPSMATMSDLEFLSKMSLPDFFSGRPGSELAGWPAGAQPGVSQSHSSHAFTGH
ncbi:unnamed protein product, partial [Polarella glacialis]